MATSMQVGLANLREGKPLKKKSRSRVHIFVGLLVLGAVAAAGAYIAKRGLPDIDPVKVRENLTFDASRTVPGLPSAPDPARPNPPTRPTDSNPPAKSSSPRRTPEPERAPSPYPPQVHRAIDKAGYFGIALYVLGFGLAELLHLPAMVFVVAGVLCWGKFGGWLLALVMAPLSCSLSFLVVRKIGGQVLADVQWSVVQKMMAKLDEWPVRTVVTLRLCFFLAPAINDVLALSTVSFRDFAVGTVCGLVVPLTVAVFFIDRLIEYMGWSKHDVDVAHALNASPPPGGMFGRNF